MRGCEERRDADASSGKNGLLMMVWVCTTWRISSVADSWSPCDNLGPCLFFFFFYIRYTDRCFDSSCCCCFCSCSVVSERHRVCVAFLLRLLPPTIHPIARLPPRLPQTDSQHQAISLRQLLSHTRTTGSPRNLSPTASPTAQQPSCLSTGQPSIYDHQ